MKGISAAVLVLVAATLPGCARMADTAQSLFVSSTPAVALVGAQLVQGQLQVYNDNTGFIALEGNPQRQPVLRCSGRMPVTGTFSREIDLRCSNGVQTRIAMNMRTDLRGFAYGGEGEQAVSLVFGLESSEVLALLKPPAQMALTIQDGYYTLARSDALEQASATSALPPVEAAGTSTVPPAAPAQ